MLANSTPVFLLVSPDPALLAELEPVLTADGTRVEVFFSARAALLAMTATHAPTLALIDVNLPDFIHHGMDPGMSMGQFLASARADSAGRPYPIVLISDTVTQEWIDRLAEGVV